MGKTVGLLTPGQAPWLEVARQLAPWWGPDVDVVEAGALDGLDRAEIEALRPERPGRGLWVRLRDGQGVAVDAEGIRARLEAALRRLESWGADVIVLLCTCPLGPLESRRPLVDPSRLLPAAVEGLRGVGRIGVVTPPLRDPERYRAKWLPFGERVAFAAAAPFGAEGDWYGVTRQLAEAGVELVVLDCLGYSEDDRAALCRGLRVPVLQACRLVGAAVGNLL